ncbi:uncharacterized protein [Dermacentor albipictus]|uniref:uncharacterized protein isoform X2 n=1 Tax=Dermacentor albipictus TaxID=60249 RepID=UPI0038FCDA26
MNCFGLFVSRADNFAGRKLRHQIRIRHFTTNIARASSPKRSSACSLRRVVCHRRSFRPELVLDRSWIQNGSQYCSGQLKGMSKRKDFGREMVVPESAGGRRICPRISSWGWPCHFRNLGRRLSS